jgi:hypothetical protein
MRTSCSVNESTRLRYLESAAAAAGQLLLLFRQLFFLLQIVNRCFVDFSMERGSTSLLRDIKSFGVVVE